VGDAGGTTRREIPGSRIAGWVTRGVVAVVLPFAVWWPVDRALAAYYLRGDMELAALFYYPVTFAWLVLFVWIALMLLLRRVTKRSHLRVAMRALVLVMIWAVSMLLITRLIRPSATVWRGMALLCWAAVVASTMARSPVSTQRQLDLLWPEEGEEPGPSSRPPPRGGTTSA